MPRIAVEHPFTDIQQALKESGYQADMLEQKSKAARYDVLVVRSLESYDGVQFKGSLVETSGRTIYEIVEEVKERLQRAGKINGEPAPAKRKPNGRYFTGLLSGAAIGSAVALLLTPKSGKELQVTLKEKLASGNADGTESGTWSQVKEKATDLVSAAKEQATKVTAQVKEKVSGSSNEEQKTDSQKESKPSSAL
ncbi:YkuS family protein [Planomicrobium sp. CPCC 101079]|uniref:YkuS family protein n=1 Tax=Planomicrobium sp. CPCC 101079 TaxID=2599618 RepID=UPI0011B56019|nr:YkuS family protein [Planomicrobium sp. CPCC 101079]TWT14302.1 hypothetical protein FQV28_01500 [Planomicrobium sp. CPCC 101079]